MRGTTILLAFSASIDQLGYEGRPRSVSIHRETSKNAKAQSGDGGYTQMESTLQTQQ
jgi:hypothetical protein